MPGLSPTRSGSSVMSRPNSGAVAVRLERVLVAEPLVEPHDVGVVGVDAHEERLGAGLLVEVVDVAVEHVERRGAHARAGWGCARAARCVRAGRRRPAGQSLTCTSVRHVGSDAAHRPRSAYGGSSTADADGDAGRLDAVPELPEVESLATYLRAHRDRAARRARRARRDQRAEDLRPAGDRPRRRARHRRVARRGKFLDVASSTRTARCCTSSRTWRAPAGCTGARRCRRLPPKPGKGPLAFRVGFVDDDGVPAGGFDLTEAGTRKRLAVYVVARPADDRGHRAPRPRAARRRLHRRRARRDPRRGRRQADQGRAARPVDHRGHRQRLQRRHPARRAALAVQGRGKLDARRDRDAARGDPRRAHRRRRRARRASAPATSRPRRSSACACTAATGQPCPVCGDVVREVSFADSSLQYCATCQTDGKPLADRRLSKLLK